ncbi:MAG: hypothetical protein HQ559_11460 [Lentisphaerae bacterium]|nr:hypothetical protein [Lentisphaerota bacterium]
MSKTVFFQSALMAIITLSAINSHAETIAVPVQQGDDAVRARLKVGPSGNGMILIHFVDGTNPIRLPLRVRPQQFSVGFDGWTKRNLPDGILSVGGVDWYARPRVRRYRARMPSGALAKKVYGGKLQKDWIERWGSLIPASESFVTLEAHQRQAEVDLFLNGQFIGTREAPGAIEEMVLVLGNGGTVGHAESFKHDRTPGFCLLDMSAIARLEGGMKDAALSIEPGLTTIKSVPMRVARSADNADIGQVKKMMGSWMLECNEFLSRTALDGMAETVHFSVPRAWYTRAYALCAVDPDPAKVPIITARLTRYATSGRAKAISDATVILPRGGDSVPGVTRVGTATLRRGDKKLETPLYLVEFRLAPGAIIDLLSMEDDPHASMRRVGPYLDFEFLGKLMDFGVYRDCSRYVDNTSTSAVHVFGATLEKAPVELRLPQAQPGNIFHNEEEPKITADLRADTPCTVSLEWRISDIRGKTLKTREQVVALEPGVRRTLPIALRMDDDGWYGLEFTLRGPDGHELYSIDTSYAQLGQDTRRAGYDSPYAGWWFAAHYGVRSPDIAGPLLHKAGIRKITTHGMRDRTEADFAKWRITLGMVPWARELRKLETPNQIAKAETYVTTFFEKYPHCPRYAMILHESVREQIPDELRGIAQVEDEKTKAQSKELVETVANAAKFYREKFPDMKLLVGNSQTSSGAISRLLRYGLNPKYIDYIGSEIVGQTFAPEKLDGGLGGVWLGEETAREFGVERPTTACYEFTSRMSKTLGLRGQAEHYVRDALISYAFGFKTIYTGLLNDAGNAYYNTAWGGGGLLRRNPLLTPKPAYVAIATLTKVMDRARFVRKIPTGSTTVYALEFRRADGRYVYSLWTPRGRAKLQLWPSTDAQITLVSLYGAREQRSAETSGYVNVECGTEPVYAVSTVPVRSVTLLAREYAAPPKSFRVVNHMDRIDAWRHVQDDASLVSKQFRVLPIRRLGDFAFSQVRDDEKGDCLQLRLNRKATCLRSSASTRHCVSNNPWQSPADPTRSGCGSRATAAGGRSSSRSRMGPARSGARRAPTTTGPADWRCRAMAGCSSASPSMEAPPRRSARPAGAGRAGPGSSSRSRSSA